jgi:hypothetical protein
MLHLYRKKDKMGTIKRNTWILASLLLLLFSNSKANVIVDGYTDKRSYNPGDTLKVFLNGTTNCSACQVYLFDINNNVVDVVTTSITPQIPTGLSPWENGFGYSMTFAYTIPATLSSGIYRWENNVFFIVKSAAKNAAITLIYPTNTEEAYNPAAGKSLYDFNSTGGRSHIVSFQRPYNSWMVQAVRGFSTGLLQWLNTINTLYDFQMVADVDMDDYAEIQQSQIIVVVGHSEYWTREARTNFDLFVASGKDAVVLSGNTMWWQVRYNADKTKLICYKDSLLDPEQDPLLKTINWTVPSLQYSIINSIGADWLHGAYANKPAYHGVYGYKIVNPASPLLNGTGASMYTIINCQGNEDDATLFYGLSSSGDPLLDTTTLGFCKIELIGYDWGESLSYPNAPQTGYGTFIAFRKTMYSGNIINVGNSNWCAINTGAATGGFGGSDVAAIKTITQNMFTLLLSGNSIYASGENCNAVITTDPAILFSAPKIYPNPVSDNIVIRFDKVPGDIMVFELYSSIGQLILSKPVWNIEEILDVSAVPPGAYFYLVRNRGAMNSKGEIIITR